MRKNVTKVVDATTSEGFLVVSEFVFFVWVLFGAVEPIILAR